MDETEADPEGAVTTEPGSESALEHLTQLDHWTFLCALGLVVVNIVVNSRKLSLSAAALLAVSLLYDLYEFWTDTKR
jgi:hypothetical protein